MQKFRGYRLFQQSVEYSIWQLCLVPEPQSQVCLVYKARKARAEAIHKFNVYKLRRELISRKILRDFGWFWMLGQAPMLLVCSFSPTQALSSHPLQCLCFMKVFFSHNGSSVSLLRFILVFLTQTLGRKWEMNVFQAHCSTYPLSTWPSE